MKFSKNFSLNENYPLKISASAESEEQIQALSIVLDSSGQEFSQLIVFDTIGNLISARKFFSSTEQIQFNRINKDKNGPIYLSGSSIKAGKKSGIISKISKDGLQLWNFKYSFANSLKIKSVEVADSSVFIFGSIQDGNEKGFILKISKQGAIEKMLLSNSPQELSFESGKVNKQNEIFISGLINQSELVIFHLDKNLNILQQKKLISTASRVYLNDLLLMNDSTLLIAGYIEGLSPIANDGFILKWSSNAGTDAKTKIFSVNNDLKIHNIKWSEDLHKILALGTSEYYGNGIDNSLEIVMDDYFNPKTYRVGLNTSNSTLYNGNFLSNTAYYSIGIQELTGNQRFINLNLARINESFNCLNENAQIDTFSISWISQSLNASLDSVAILKDTLSINTQVNNLNEFVLCLEGQCKSDLKIAPFNKNPCIGDSLVFSINGVVNSYQWGVNGSLFSSDSTLTLVYDGDSINIVFSGLDKNNCAVRDFIDIEKSGSEIMLQGNFNVCINHPLEWYHLSYDDQININYQVKSGTIINETKDSIQIQWDTNFGSITIFQIDSNNCKISQENYTVRLDSGSSMRPLIHSAGIDTKSELQIINFELPDYNLNVLEVFSLYGNLENIKLEITQFIENEKIWLNPNSKSEITNFEIEGKNECGFSKKSNAHSPILLEESGSVLNWSSYLGWNKSDIDYTILKNGEPYSSPSINSFALRSLDEKNSCYRIMAVNRIRPEFPSFSNELCLEEQFELFIPNVISPNGDGKNDYLMIPKSIYFDNMEIEIFNRWGRKIYSQSNYQNNWPNQSIENGTYFYQLKLKFEGLETHYKSWLQIVK